MHKIMSYSAAANSKKEKRMHKMMYNLLKEKHVIKMLKFKYYQNKDFSSSSGNQVF